MNVGELHRSLTNQTPRLDADATDRIEAIRSAAIDFGEAILEHAPPSREQSLAITNLEQSVMWAVKSIVLEGEPS